MENNYWIDLIGFDVNNKESSLKKFIENNDNKIDGLYLHIMNCDFFAAHEGMSKKYKLTERECSPFPFSLERSRQEWTNYDLREFVDICHKYGVKVYVSMVGTVTSGGGKPGKFAVRHPYLLFKSTINGESWAKRSWGAYHLAKRFNDGTFFEDYLADKAKEVLVDYNFDGLHISDIIVFTLMQVVKSDFSDDLVEQFVQRMGIELPSQYKIKNTTIKEQQKRCRYIIANLRYEWSVFMSERYGEAVGKLIKAAHSVNKQTCLVNAWTCSPFEGLYRFGVDYRLYNQAGADKYMFEDAIGVNLANWKNNESEMNEDERRYWNLRLMGKQGALKCCASDVKIVNMTSIHDTFEQWNVIDNAPNEFKSSIVKRNIVYVWQNGKLIPSCEGSIFCLSDGLSKNDWSRIHTTIDKAQTGNPIDCLGFTSLYDDDLRGQLKEFIQTHRHNFEYINYRMLKAGLSITAYANKKEIFDSRGPLLITAESLRDDDVVDYLERTKRLLVVAGYRKVLERKASASFYCGDFQVNIYNSKNSNNGVYFAGYKKAKLQDPINLYWVELPNLDLINENLFEAVVDFINKEGSLPYSIKPHEFRDAGRKVYPKKYSKGNFNFFTYKMSENKYRMVVMNFDNHFNYPFIKFPYEVKKLSFVGLPELCSPIIREGYIFFKLNNRDSAIIDIEI